MNRFKVLVIIFSLSSLYMLANPISTVYACTCADQGSPDYGDPAIIGKEAWCACAVDTCHDTGAAEANGGCTKAPPEPPSCKTTTICGQSVTGNSPSDCRFSCDGTNAKYDCTQSDNNNCVGAVYCSEENSRCAATPPSCKTTTICGQSAAGNSPSDCTPRCEGTVATYYCEQSDNRACNGTIHCSGENSRCGGNNPTQTSQPTTRPTARPTQSPAATIAPVKSALTVTKIQINGQDLDLNGKLKITLPDTFKTLNPQTKIDVTFSDGSTKSFYLGFRYLAPPSATLALSPATGTFNKSCNFSLKINVDTGGNQTDGTDAALLYDPSRLSVTSIINGTIYEDYTPQTIDQANGKVILSGLSKAGSRYSGQGTLATVNFKVADNAPSGTTQVKFNFDPNNRTKTTDSNVVQTGTVNDILSSVTDGNYTIGTDSCTSPTPSATPTTAPASSTPTPRPSPTLSPTLRIYDLNKDSAINTFDPATFIKDWKNCPSQIDFDHNGTCNARDYSMLKNQL